MNALSEALKLFAEARELELDPNLVMEADDDEEDDNLLKPLSPKKLGKENAAVRAATVKQKEREDAEEKKAAADKAAHAEFKAKKEAWGLKKAKSQINRKVASQAIGEPSSRTNLAKKAKLVIGKGGKPLTRHQKAQNHLQLQALRGMVANAHHDLARKAKEGSDERKFHIDRARHHDMKAAAHGNKALLYTKPQRPHGPPTPAAH